MKTACSNRCRSAFTLVELLTVVAIIGVLAAILIPTVGRMRSSAQATRCGTGLRQTGQAVLLFAAEHKGRAPIPNGASSNGEGHWHVQIAPYFGVVFSDETATADQKKTVKVGQPAGCPLAPHYGTGADVQAIGVSYGWTAVPIVAGMPLLQTGVYLNQVPNPGRTIMIGERWGKNAAGNRDTNWQVDPPYVTAPLNTDETDAGGAVSAVRVSHGGRSNFLFFDGHVAAFTPAETYNAANLAVGNFWRGL
jgi:prepilin-type processing-associated H-X9-DG protein/prepilin-type N-terminal cleavage/methylation domain-containing protein